MNVAHRWVCCTRPERLYTGIINYKLDIYIFIYCVLELLHLYINTQFKSTNFHAMQVQPEPTKTVSSNMAQPHQ